MSMTDMSVVAPLARISRVICIVRPGGWNEVALKV